jgi:hypothetical protein
METPFSLRIFVADGDPDGLRIVDKSNWIGKALVFPRALLPQVKARPELAQTGVYLQKVFWTRAIGFTPTTAGQPVGRVSAA